MTFHPVERTILLTTGGLTIADFCLIWWKNIAIGVDFFALPVGFATLLIVIGQICRSYWDSERVALVTHAIGLFLLYSLIGALFNSVLPPLPAPIDPALVRMGAWLGYSWPVLCAWIADYPMLNEVLRTVYKLTLAQLLIVFVFLSLMLDRRRLHVTMLSAVLASLAVIFCWALFPSGGASAYWTLAPEIDRIVRPVIDSKHGAELYRLYSDGIQEVSAVNVSGLIGFPSFHTVMGLVSIIAVWPYRALRFTLIVFGVFLFPAILIHGGHNLMDVFAGMAITVVAWSVALKLFDTQERLERNSAPVMASPGRAPA